MLSTMSLPNSRATIGPEADVNATFAIHSQAAALLEKHARKAFIDAHVHDAAFPAIDAIQPFTFFSPAIEATAPRCMGGPLEDSQYLVDDDTLAFLREANAHLENLKSRLHRIGGAAAILTHDDFAKAFLL